MEGSSKRLSGSKKKQIRPKVRQNLSEPAKFWLQDEPDTTQPFQHQSFQPQPFHHQLFQSQIFPPFQSQPYQNQQFIPPFSNQQPFQSQPYADPLEDSKVIQQFAREFREPHQKDDDDDNEWPIQEEEEIEAEAGGPLVMSQERRPWTSDEEVALTKAFLYEPEKRKRAIQQKRADFRKRVVIHFNKLPGSTNLRSILYPWLPQPFWRPKTKR